MSNRTLSPRQCLGFTYVGLLIFVAVLGVIAAATVSAGALMQRRAAETELLAIGKEFRAAFKSYSDASGGAKPYPLTLSALTKDERAPNPHRHLRKIYFDPLTGKDEWGIIEAPGGGIMGVYSLSTEKPIKIAEFDAEFAGFTGKKKYSDWVFAYDTSLPPAGTVSNADASETPTTENSNTPTTSSNNTATNQQSGLRGSSWGSSAGAAGGMSSTGGNPSTPSSGLGK